MGKPVKLVCETYHLSVPGLHRLSKFLKKHKGLFFVSQMKIIKEGSRLPLLGFFFY